MDGGEKAIFRLCSWCGKLLCARGWPLATRDFSSLIPPLQLMTRIFGKSVTVALLVTLLTSCHGLMDSGLMGGPTATARATQIANEPRGEFFYGRRYFVKYTRFWGYLRKPQQSAKQACLVVFNESRLQAPDRLPEDGPVGRRYAFDQNYEYRIWGYYTGRKVYENYSNQILPEFQLVDYQLIDKQPGWLFRPDDVYKPTEFKLIPH